jgi:secondary thiamine-phosphate synthase enzyme
MARGGQRVALVLIAGTKREPTMRQAAHTLDLTTHGRGLLDITPRVRDWIRHSGFRDGLLTVFVRHTSASLLIQENADPGVQRDLERFFARLAPDGDPLFEHDQEGDDDMPAHVRSALTQTHLSIPLGGGHLALGTWQGIYLWEHRRVGHRREVVLHLFGE